MEKMNVRKHWIDNLRRIPLARWCGGGTNKRIYSNLKKCLKIFKDIPLCPGREHFYILIISVLQNKQAETQAIFEHHNIRMIALK